MRNILKIFSSDVKSIVRHFFAAVIVVAITIIPALYAWFNIYANGDPYANTGNISVAVASEDTGYNGINKGEAIIDNLKKSDSINWVFPGSAEAAKKGVDSGKYYAAIIINENFSRNMYSLKSALEDDGAEISYYENGKKNAVANKITETAAETVEHNIQVEYLKVLFETVLKQSQELGNGIDDKQTAESFAAQLTELSGNLRGYGSSIGNFIADSNSVSYVLSGIADGSSAASSSLKDSEGKINNTRTAISNAEASVVRLSEGIDSKLAEIEEDLNSVGDALDRISSDEALQGSIEKRNEIVDSAINAAAQLQAHLESLRATLPKGSDVVGTAYVARTLDALIERSTELQEQLRLLHDDESYAEDAAGIVNACSDTVSVMRSLLKDNLTPGVKQALNSLSNLLKLLVPLVDSLGVTLDDIAPVVNSAGDTISYVSSSLARLQSLLTRAADGIDELIAKINDGIADERVQTIAAVLNGNAEKYAEFLSSPVDVVSKSVYPVENYGSAMTPFYSVLAIWVGGVMLVAIIKVEVEPKNLTRVSENQKFWGRGLLFFLLGQAQAAIIILGDVFILHCQCENLFLFWLSAAVTSFVFISLIYSLTLSFGDLGKAIVVVIMVVQIAGSSGSYPIEILPNIFSAIYRFFPFPYAINAMRETICGMYGFAYWIYIGELLIFGVVGLLIGLVARKPFIRLNRFVELEMENTGVL